MIPPEKLEVLESLLGPLPRPQKKTLILAVQAVVSLSQAASIAIAAFFAQVTGSQMDSALTRFYRLLHNPRLDDLRITKQVLTLLAKRPIPFLMALDWTEWHPPLRMLLASVVVGGRAIPVQAAVFSKTQVVRSQNTWENSFLRVLCLLLNEVKVQACFLADRGFRRVSFLKLLLEQAGHTFLVRIGDQIMVETSQWKRLLARCSLQPGQARDLGTVLLRADGAVVVRVIGIWAKGQREPWWLATNREDSLSYLASLYDRRMAIEEQIRDTKGARFGLQLVWTQIKTPEALARFTLLIGLALLLLTTVGYALTLRQPKIQLPSKSKGPRLSLLSVGRFFFLSFLQNQTISTRFLIQNIPKPTLRSFPWIDAQTKKKTQN